MLADAEQTTAATAAELAHAAVFTADGYSDDEGVDHVSIDPGGSQTLGLAGLAAELIAAEADWLANADRTEEVKAGRAGLAVTAEDEAIWKAASDRHWAAVDALTRHRPRSAAELLEKARLLTNNGDTRLRAEEQFGEVYLQDAEAVVAMALDAALSLPALRPAWDQARADYDRAQATYRAVRDKWDAVYDGLVKRAPAWNIDARISDGEPILKYHSLKNFDVTRRISDLTSARRGEMITWVVCEDAALREYHDLSERIDQTYGEVCEEERRLLETPAPDLAAVTFKQSLFGLETDDDKGGYDHRPRYMAVRDASFVVEAWPALIHEDCLRLTGMPPPQPGDLFKPRQWKTAFEAIGGKVSLGKTGRPTVDIENVTEDASALLAEIGDAQNREALQIWLEMLK